ncbi:MAG: glycosyltransferase family 4 protein [Candidatus Bathyarchaeota archaeon]|nr:glycosyltransferase family 4 protein [Candidatus Bathyarchaeota archaeon]
MNILIIPTNDWTRAAGAGHINSIAEELAARGHRVYAWNFDLYRNQPIKRLPRKVKLIKSKTLPLSDPAAFFTLNAFAMGPAVFKAIRKLEIDAVINENILCGLVAFFAAGTRALKVFDFSDYFPESASVYYRGSSEIVKKLVEGVSLAVTKLNIKFSDICVAVCQSLVKNAQNTDKTKPCYLVTNGVDTRSKPPAPKKDAAKNPNRSLVVMGVIDDWLDLETPLKALHKLNARYPDLKLVVIGPWQKPQFRRQFESQAASRGLEKHVEVTGYISSQHLKRRLTEASCCIMPYKLNSYFAAIRLPEKLFVYSAYGKPILSTRLPEVTALNTKHVFFYCNSDELADAADAVLSDHAHQENLSEKACAFAREHDFKVLAKTLEDILSRHLRRLRTPQQV